MDTPETPDDAVHRKVFEIFAEIAGDRSRRLDPGVLSTPAMDAVTAAFADEYGAAKANEIGINMADWNWDAAFVVALHLFPERFTSEEIAAGVRTFLAHAPNHIREACRLTGTYVWADFPDDYPDILTNRGPGVTSDDPAAGQKAS